PGAEVPGRHRPDDRRELVAVARGPEAQGAERGEQEETEQAEAPGLLSIRLGLRPGLLARSRRLGLLGRATLRSGRNWLPPRPGEPGADAPAQREQEAQAAEDHGRQVEAEWQAAATPSLDEPGDRRQLRDVLREDRAAHRLRELDREEGPGEPIR